MLSRAEKKNTECGVEARSEHHRLPTPHHVSVVFPLPCTEEVKCVEAYVRICVLKIE